jgi:hypothetical protein
MFNIPKTLSLPNSLNEMYHVLFGVVLTSETVAQNLREVRE